MRVLTEREQLSDKIFEIDKFINDMSNKLTIAVDKRQKIANSWFTSSDKRMAAQYECEHTSHIMNLLMNYRDSLKERYDALSLNKARPINS